MFAALVVTFILSLLVVWVLGKAEEGERRDSDARYRRLMGLPEPTGYYCAMGHWHEDDE